MSTLSAFGNKLVEFFKELVEVFPDERDIKMAHEAISGAKRINPRLVLDMFHEHFYVDFHRAVAERNVDLLVHLGKQKIEQKFNYIMPAIAIFNKHWDTLTVPNQEAIWAYLKVLCVLCEMTLGLPSDTK